MRTSTHFYALSISVREEQNKRWCVTIEVTVVATIMIKQRWSWSWWSRYWPGAVMMMFLFWLPPVLSYMMIWDIGVSSWLICLVDTNLLRHATLQSTDLTWRFYQANYFNGNGIERYDVISKDTTAAYCYWKCGLINFGDTSKGNMPWAELSWWRHQMETFSALLVICAGNSPVSGEFPAQRPVTRSFDVFLDLCPINDWVTIVRLVIWDAVGLNMTSQSCFVALPNLK